MDTTPTNPTVITDESIALVFPRRKVTFGTGAQAIVIEVRPINLADLDRFKDKIIAVLAKTGGVLDALGRSDDMDIARVLIQCVTPFLFTDLAELVQATCSHDISRLPHFAIAEIIDAFIAESFGDPKARAPWAKFIKSLEGHFGLEAGSILGKLSALWSARGTLMSSPSGAPGLPGGSESPSGT